jgi:CDP-diglyceride synthetase
MFHTRLISGIVLILITVALMSFGGNALLAGNLLISIVGLFELYRVLKLEKTIVAILGYLASFVYFIILYIQQDSYIFMFLVLFLIMLMGAYVFTFPRYNISNIMAAFFGVFYVVFMLSYIYKIRGLESGEILVWLVFLSAWGCDTCAYCVGKLIGKHKLAPILSPKKSIEGAIGGVIGAGLLGYIYGTIFGNSVLGMLNISIKFAIICSVASIVAQIGDLAASAIKRNFEIKDYGNIIPGHGGVLDRFDSMIFTAPIIYFIVMLVR